MKRVRMVQDKKIYSYHRHRGYGIDVDENESKENV